MPATTLAPARPRRPSQLAISLAAWWRGPRLDRQLAQGISPRASQQHAVRAQRLTSRRSRSRIADGLARVRQSTSERRPAITAAISPDRDEVLDATVVLAALERRLREAEPVAARGMALLSEVLTDPASALYQPVARGDLGSQLRAAAAALEPLEGWQ